MKGPLLVTAAVIENTRGEILIARRPFHHKIAGGLWEFPGGKVEAGEDPRACLAREIREELGAEIEVGDLICATSHVYTEGTGAVTLTPAVHIVLLIYRATLNERGREIERLDFKLSDVAEVKWVSREARPTEEFAAADVECVDILWPRSTISLL